MQTGLEGRTALVTGGTRGIGRAIARALVAEGVRVTVLGRSAAEGEQAAASMGGPGACSFAACDMTRPDEVATAVQAAARDGLDILVNNAGPPLYAGTIADTADDVWQLPLEVKAMGFVRAARAALPLLSEDGSGRIVNIAGITARTEIPNAGVTGMVNAAVAAFTGYLASEGAQRGVRVNAICPGLIHTEGWEERAGRIGERDGRGAAEVMAGMVEARGVSLGRWGTPEEVADLAVFMCSDRAAYLTGQVICLDGGMGDAIR